MTRSTVIEKLEKYLNGTELYGDDFSDKEIKEWYQDEIEGYGDLVYDCDEEYVYPYKELDKKYVFKYIKDKCDGLNVLGLGSAYAHEFYPILDKIETLTIVEPEKRFYRDAIDGKEIDYIKPKYNGDLPFQDGSFDVVTCLSVLHHIPNVTHVLKEAIRSLNNGGQLIIREPIVSMREPINDMNDWTKYKKGLTKRERGLPLTYLNAFIKDNDLKIINKKLFGMPTSRVIKMFSKKNSIYNSKIGLYIDSLTSKMFEWNYTYHTNSFIKKFRPSQIILILEKNY